jgi:phosphoribosylformylglycinamidine cyclo-ligase
MLGALAGIGDVELRATFNGGIGMVMVVPEAAAQRTVALARERGVPAWEIGNVVPTDDLGGRRYAEAGLA